jgi:competence protein ComEA
VLSLQPVPRPAGAPRAAFAVEGERPGDRVEDPNAAPAGPPTVPLPVPRIAAWRRRWSGRSDRAPVRRLRLDPGRPAAVALVLVAAVAAVVAAVGVWTSRPQAEPVRGLPAVAVDGVPDAGEAKGADGAATGAGPTATAGVAAAKELVVSVAGRVAHPGVVRVRDGARVADALDAAGGARPGVDLSGLNLARRLVDGEQIAVGVPPAPDAGGQLPSGATAAEAEAAHPGSGGAASAGAGLGPKIDLNTSSVAQLDTLPGVGPVTAQHIVEWRSRNGRFVRVDQLREIDGIGERRFQQLRDLVTV